MPKGVYKRKDSYINPMLGKKHTPEAIEKMRSAKKDRVVSDETRKKLSQNNARYWLGKTFKHTDEAKKKISESSKNRVVSKETRKKIGLSKTGEKCPWWKGGVTKPNDAIRKSTKYRDWRKAVFERDNYTCVFCGVNGGTLNADHIKSFAMYPELRLDVNNGRTLCVPCHKTTDSYAKNLTKI